MMRGTIIMKRCSMLSLSQKQGHKVTSLWHFTIGSTIVPEAKMPRKFQLSRKKKWLEKRRLRAAKVRIYIATTQQLVKPPVKVEGFELLQSLIKLPSPDWCNQSSSSQIRLCKVSSQPHCSSVEDPLSIYISLLVDENLSWTVFVQGKQIDRNNTPLLSTVPDTLDSSGLVSLLALLNSAAICPGHPDPRYTELAEHRKGTFTSQDGRVRATLDKRHTVASGGRVYQSTIRTTGCELLTDDGGMCDECKAFGSTLRSMYSRWSARADEVSKYTNNRYIII